MTRGSCLGRAAQPLGKGHRKESLQDYKARGYSTVHGEKEEQVEDGGGVEPPWGKARI